MAKEVKVQFSIVVGDSFDHDGWVKNVLSALDAHGAMATAQTQTEEMARDVALAHYGRDFN